MSKIAVVSTAHIHTKGYLENLAKGKDGRCIHAIWDNNAERGQRYAATFNTKFVADLRHLLRDRDADGFIICAENTRHLPLLKKVLRVGKPVFCEKPLVTTVADLRKVIKILNKHRAKLMCGYVQPFTGVMQAVAKMLEDKAFGQVTRVRFRSSHSAAYGRWFDSPDLQWFHNPELAGGGAFMDMGTHAIHLLRTLFGPVAEVWATNRNESGAYGTVDDFGVAHLKFASGVFGTVEAAWTQTGGIGGLEIVGSQKTFWNNGKEYVVAGPKESPMPVSPLPARPAGVDRLVAIIQGNVTNEELKTDLDAVADSVAIMEAAYKSSRTGKWVKVPSVTPSCPQAAQMVKNMPPPSL